MKNTNIKQITFTAVMGLFLSACGGGSSSITSFPPVEVKVPECGTETVDVTGKTIEKVGIEAEVRILHSPDGTKLACMISGEAIVVNTN